MEEKQALKNVYGIREQQLKNYYNEAQKSQEQTGTKLITLLEKRLDNAVYRAGFAPTRAAARQMSSHRLLQVNGRSVDIPSIRLRVDDVVSVKESKRKKPLLANFQKSLQNTTTPSWILLDPDNFLFKITGEPTSEEAGIGVDIQSIVEYFAR